MLVIIMARVEIGEYRAQDAHYGFYRDDLPSGDVILIRRKVGEPTDYLHPNSRKVRLQRLNFGLASTHYSHLTPIQKKELKYVVEEVPFSRGRSKSDTKVLQGRTLFISKDIHALNETQKQLPTPLQICIVLTDQDLNPIEGDLWLYYQIDGDWGSIDRRLLSPSYWLFPLVPRNRPLYHPVGRAYDFYDPQDPETTYLTQKELMLYHYHRLSPRPTIASEILRPIGTGDLNEIWTQRPPTGEHWDKVDDVLPDEDETYLWMPAYSKATKRDLFTLEPPTIGVYDIKQVTLFGRFRSAGYYVDLIPPKLLLKTHDQLFEQTYEDVKYSWETVSWSLDKNPATGEPWTLDELTTLQAGIALSANYGFRRDASGYCTQFYAEPEYYAPQ
ncbi:hypothetical protein ES703_117567 [subsurface metagenome]